jgi:hypothetical protein
MKPPSTVTPASGAKWPLTGGVASQLSITKDNGIERVYLAGYSDGSIRIWDATCPVLSFICLLEGEVRVPSNLCFFWWIHSDMESTDFFFYPVLIWKEGIFFTSIFSFDS